MKKDEKRCDVANYILGFFQATVAKPLIDSTRQARENRMSTSFLASSAKRFLRMQNPSKSHCQKAVKGFQFIMSFVFSGQNIVDFQVTLVLVLSVCVGAVYGFIFGVLDVEDEVRAKFLEVGGKLSDHEKSAKRKLNGSECGHACSEQWALTAS